MSTLASYDQAKQALAEVRTAAQAKDVRDKAAALATYAQRARDRDMEVWAAEIRLRAERRLGEILADVELNPGALRRGTKLGPSTLPTLRQIGITKDLSAAAQRLAAVPEDRFEMYIARCLKYRQPPRGSVFVRPVRVSRGGRVSARPFSNIGPSLTGYQLTLDLAPVELQQLRAVANAMGFNVSITAAAMRVFARGLAELIKENKA